MQEKQANRRGRPTEQQAAQKRVAILDCATKLFLSTGYRGVTIRKVAASTGVSTTTVYNMFKDKASLFSACIDHLRPPPFRPDETATDTFTKLRNIGQAIVQDLSQPDRVGFFRLLIKDGREFRKMSEAADADYHALQIAPVSAILEAGGLQEPGDTSIAHLFIIMASAEWTRCVAYDRPMPSATETRDHVSKVTRILLSGLSAV